MYRLSAYYFSKMISELPALLLQPMIIHLITYWATGLNRTPYYIVSLLAIASGAILSQVNIFFIQLCFFVNIDNNYSLVFKLNKI